jgi:hypothetical protein
MRAILPEREQGVKEGEEAADNADMGKKKMKLASWLVAHSLMTLDQANTVIAEQAKQTGHIKDRFGRIAVNMGFITEAQLNKAALDKEREETGF